MAVLSYTRLSPTLGCGQHPVPVVTWDVHKSPHKWYVSRNQTLPPSCLVMRDYHQPWGVVNTLVPVVKCVTWDVHKSPHIARNLHVKKPSARSQYVSCGEASLPVGTRISHYCCVSQTNKNRITIKAFNVYWLFSSIKFIVHHMILICVLILNHHLNASLKLPHPQAP